MNYIAIYLAYLVKRYLTGMLDIPALDKGLVLWLALGKYLTRAPVQVFRGYLQAGVWIHQLLMRYWSFWFAFYLKRDEWWPDTEKRIDLNPLCPATVSGYYKALLFDHEKVKDFFPTEILEIYRARQVRCGSVPQL